MPATFIRNKLNSKEYKAFYINPEGNNPNFRLFLSSKDELKKMEGALKESKIAYSVETGESFIDALKSKAASDPKRLAVISSDFGDLKDCMAIKVNGVHNLFPVSKIVSCEKFSTREYFIFLQLAMKYKKNPFKEREAILSHIASGGSTEDWLAKALNESRNTVFFTHTEFLQKAVRDKVITFTEATALGYTGLDKNDGLTKSAFATANKVDSDPDKYILPGYRG